MSVVAVLGLEGAANFIVRTSGSLTKDRLTTIDIALDKFFRVHGRLPCPAHRLAPAVLAAGVTDSHANQRFAETGQPTGNYADYGIEDCVKITVFPASTNEFWGGGVLSGAVPFRTLNLPESVALDGFNSKINYAVTKNLTLAGKTDYHFGKYDNASAAGIEKSGVGGIEIRTGVIIHPCAAPSCQIIADPKPITYPADGSDAAHPIPDGAAYIVFSNGADRRGAVTPNGVQAADCVPTTSTATYNRRPDSQNCTQGNTSILDAAVAAGMPVNVFYDNRYNAGFNNANYFDDYVIWRKRGQL